MNKIRIIPGKFLVELEGRRIYFTKKQYDIINLLYSDPEKIWLKEEIMNSVWPDVIVTDKSLVVAICQIRKKTFKNFIVNTRNVGYRINLEKNQIA